MPRERSPNRDLAKHLWLDSGKTRMLKDIAKELGVSDEQIRKWKNQDKWEIDKVTLPKKNSNVTNNKKTSRDSKQHKAKSGNPNPKNQFTERNKISEKHGLYSKYLPDETLELMDSIMTISPLDLLWSQIMIQYAAIIRAQKIMYVHDKQEMIKEIKKEKKYSTKDGGGSETEWEFQFAWDRQASFLQAQSRAMAELRSLIKQYEDTLHVNRDIATEEQLLRIEKLKTEINILKGEGQGNDQEGIDSFIKATTMEADEIKAMYEGDNDEDIQEEN